MNSHEEKEELEALLDTYSSSEILNLGKECIEDNDYIKALVIFNKGSKDFKSIKPICIMYGIMVTGVLATTNKEANKILTEDSHLLNCLIDRIFSCLFQSTEMYSNKELSKEDLFNLEALVDKIDLNKIKFSGKDDFCKLYCNFKKYVADVYVGDK